MTKRMIIMLVIVGVVFGLIFGYKAFVNTMIGNFLDNMPEQTASVTAAEAGLEQWNRETTAVGSFRAVSGAQLSTEASGIVTGIHFDNGDRVEKGQRLVSLDTATDEAELERLNAAEKLASMELERYQRLFDEGNSSRSELQRRQSEAAQTVASVKAQKERIRLKTIRAPFDGISGIRQVNIGQYISPGEPVVSVQSLDPIYLNFTLPERQLSEVDVGQAVTAQVDAFSNETFEGEVTAIEPSINEATRTFTLQATLQNPEARLRPGMFGRVTLDLGQPQELVVVPQTAIQFDPYGNSVFILAENDEGELRATRRFVRTGERRGDLIAVTDGLQEGEQIATSGLLKLRNNALVSINDDPSVQPSAELEPAPANQ
ncbi:efflux RND transporter periplasmic adaptor subunit [Marinimicrobium sp. ARAG 43.8]|uniref:efflux RND transporter periplasmic adaptor subunit n=1 Tax=Marinimicrobium sp. ARAG 43.8 TaxID=3418719 RepID=UPI003CF5C14A